MVGEQPALFEVPEADRVEPQPQMSPGRRRTIRQQQLALAGLHPLTAALRQPLQLHRDAAPAGDRDADGLRCGGCRHREIVGYHNRSYPKCLIGDSKYINDRPRFTHGEGTDVRAWWPACVDYQPPGHLDPHQLPLHP